MGDNFLEANNNYFKNQLSKYLYFIRGIAIILVVIGHVIGYNLTYGMRQVYNSNLSVLGWFCDLINTFHMPTFFVVSGIAFAAFSKKDISYKKFFTSKFQKLLIPLLVWCPPYFILQSLSKSKSFSFIDIIDSIIYPYEIFWFIHVLIFATLFAFLYFKNLQSVNFYLIVSISLFTLSVLLNNDRIQDYLFWNIFYAFGVFATKYLLPIETFLVKNRNVLTQVLLPCLCVSIMVICAYFLPKDANIDYLRLINGTIGFIFLYFISIQLIGNLENISRKPTTTLNRIIESCQYCGAASIAIYLFHGYFTGLSRAILLKVTGLPHPIAYFAILSLMGIIGPLVIYEALRTRSKLFLYSIGGAK
ncbi:acyltransferase family protein [Nostoc sp. NIES-2111]|nr:acyltransferase family protein [Nostoc sp. NIES-2111]